MKPFFLPAGWEIKLFGQCIKKVKYTEKQPTKSFLPEGKFPIVSQEKELISGYSNNQNAVFSVKNSVVIFGDHTKVVKYIDFDFVIGADGVKILQPIEEINAKYFYYYLSHLHLRDLGYARHYKLLKECIVIYPPLPEQKRIVEKLDKIFAAIDKAKSQTEKNLQNTKDIFSSYLNNIFNHPAHSWKEKTLGEVCEIERGGSPRPIKSYLTTAPNGLNWIKIGDTSPNSKYIYSVKEKIRPEGLAKSRWVQEGDFLLSNSMSFGRPYILKTNGCIHDGWLVLKQYQSNLQCDFLYYLLSSPFVQKQFQQSAQGSTVRNLNTQRVAKIIVPIPPLPEQKRIVEKLDVLQSKTQELEKIYTQKLADLEELKQSVLQQAFSGKL